MHNFLRFRFLLVLALLSVGFLSTGCDEITSPSVCTAEFVTYSVQVLTPEGEPADSVDITVRNVDSGEEYEVCEALSMCDQPVEERYGEEGQYLIFHDGLDVSSFGDDVLVTGQTDSFEFQANYVFRQGECHVQKEAGPEQVTLRK